MPSSRVYRNATCKTFCCELGEFCTSFQWSNPDPVLLTMMKFLLIYLLMVQQKYLLMRQMLTLMLTKRVKREEGGTDVTIFVRELLPLIGLCHVHTLLVLKHILQLWRG